MLPGVKLLDLDKKVDERGFFVELLRGDWGSILRGDKIVQANLSVILPGVVKAWHRHTRGQVDYIIVIGGAAKVCIYDDGRAGRSRLDEIVLSSERLRLATIPGHYWHGIKALGNEKASVLYLHNRLYNYKNPDEERRRWDDPSFVDHRTGQPYDWTRPPHM